MHWMMSAATWPTVTCGTTNLDSLAKAEECQVIELKMASMSLIKSIPPEMFIVFIACPPQPCREQLDQKHSNGSLFAYSSQELIFTQ
jgi:hypothetical protein